MKKPAVLLGVLLVFSYPALAQRGGASGRGEVGHPAPAHGPAEFHGTPHAEANRNFNDAPSHPNAPHVHQDGRWIGHDTGRSDPHYHLDHPFEHGHFNGGFGPSHVWRLSGGGPGRFGFGGFFFGSAPSGFGYCDGWYWD